MANITLGPAQIDAVFGLPLQRQALLLDGAPVGVLEVFDRRAPFVDPNPDQKLAVVVAMLEIPSPSPEPAAKRTKTA